MNAYFGFYEFWDQLHLFAGWSEDWQLGSELAVGFLLSLPFAPLTGLPLAAVFWNWRQVWRGWSWLEWSGILITTAWYFCNVVHSLTSALMSTPLWYVLTSLGLSYILDIVGLLLGMKLCRWLNPWFQRWIAEA